jgi:hypothetical protein
MPLKLKVAKNLKPYFVCNDCGIQIFIRGKQGIKLLAVFIKDIRISLNDSLKIMTLSRQIMNFQKEIEKIEEQENKILKFLSIKNPALEQLKTSHHKQIEKLQQQIDAIIKKGELL